MAAFFKKPVAALIALLLSLNLSVNLSTFKTKYADIDPGQYKNVILFIGDGMGYNSLAWTEKEYGVKLEMLARSPIHGYSKTRSSSDAVTDSAAGGTALACATRTTNRAIGVFPQDQYSLAVDAMNLCELAQSYGRMTGVVTTDTNNGATPAAFSAHTDDRGNGEEISRQQIEESDLDLIWSAKSEYVTEEHAVEYGWTYLDSLADFEELEEGERSFGQFEGEIWREKSGADSPTLSAMTAKAIDMLDDDPDGFFLMVEGAHIDKNSHNNNSEGMTAAALEFNKAIDGAYDYADEHGDTLIVITADHETGGIKIDENGEFYYTTDDHSSTDVPILVYGCDKFIQNGETIKNKEIARRLSLAMGAKIGDFPCAISVDELRAKAEPHKVDPGAKE